MGSLKKAFFVVFLSFMVSAALAGCTAIQSESESETIARGVGDAADIVATSAVAIEEEITASE